MSARPSRSSCSTSSGRRIASYRMAPERACLGTVAPGAERRKGPTRVCGSAPHSNHQVGYVRAGRARVKKAAHALVEAVRVVGRERLGDVGADAGGDLANGGIGGGTPPPSLVPAPRRGGA